MSTPTPGGKAPEWLRSRWERTKCETAARIQAAVDQLRQHRRDVTFESIREAIRSTGGFDFRKHNQAERTGIRRLPGELPETQDGPTATAGAERTGR